MEEAAFSGSFITLLIGLITLLLLYWYTTRNHDYWRKRKIPFVKPLPIIGTLLDSFYKPLHVIEIERYRKYGQIYGQFDGSGPGITIGDPRLLKNIMVKDFPTFSSRGRGKTGDPIVDKMLVFLNGADWKRIRTIITPTFTTGKIKKMMSIFKDSAKTCVNSFKKYAASKKPVDAKIIYGAFTMDVIASSAFSTKIDSYNDPNNKFVSTARSLFSRGILRFILFTIVVVLRIPLPIKPSQSKGMKFFKEVTLQIIEERTKTGKTRNDFLQLLLDTAEETAEQENQFPAESEDVTANYGKDDVSENMFKNTEKKTSLSQDEMVAQCIIFFLAGYETTASTLSFASYILALHPEIQELLIAELDESLKASNGEVTYETLQNMKYLDNVISETLRLYPPAARLQRLADQDYVLGDTGITIPKGMPVNIPVCAMHIDPKLHPEPESFKPERFSQDEKAKRDMYAYLPFGAGPRNCIGMRFALIEIKVCLAFILSNFRFRRCPQTKVPLEFRARQPILQPKHVTLLMEPRTDGIKAV
ncbi:cytochrome P450 3A11-like [Uloborus diversus]|uniref:cytochrome P450 3A11-like n=1 Tax=Uloborus diversus TaxID=327109 RepID=UPI002409BFAF|nr:cytochrome P450 3A11-like [Uloborus diversus]